MYEAVVELVHAHSRAFISARVRHGCESHHHGWDPQWWSCFLVGRTNGARDTVLTLSIKSHGDGSLQDQIVVSCVYI